ncbi:blue-light-activated protein [Geobacter sp. OR-1]|uniref:PAS domain-containing hybrid sensor histidine kinase/response regulator n=1 Tax=Geobacter sp. OR-1 TaxID=1266765 RepID=UPI000541FAE2|nr:PAS domain S-box protein [Geobacter sp. OR-1]GAM08990.1 blue-light-activated protein [Geobacter sp. OR-1]
MTAKSGERYIPSRPALRIVCIYAVVAGLWILLSDRLLTLMVKDQELITLIATIKGWLFVIVTATLLYGLISRLAVRIGVVRELKTILDTTRDGFYVTDMSGRFIEVNNAYCSLSGYSREELLAMRIADVEASESDAEVSGHLRKIISLGYDCFETSHRRCDGSLLDIEASVTYNSDRGGVFYSFIRDISGRKQAEAELREKDEQLQMSNFSIDRMLDPIYWVDKTGRIRRVNNAACLMLGYSAAEFMEMSVKDIDPTFPAEKWPAHWQELAEEGSLRLETIHWAKDGRLIDVEVVANFLNFQGSEYNCAVVRDVSEHKRALRELAASESKFRSLFKNMLEGVALHRVVKDAEGTIINYRIVEVNPSYETILGLSKESVVGRLATDVYGTGEPPYLTEYSNALATGAQLNFETYFAPLERYFSISVIKWEDDGFATIFSDVTLKKKAEEDRRLLEERMQHAQKLESLGILAGGIAHDFNNILTAVVGNADIALMQVSPESPVVENLRRIEKAAARATDLARQMLAYSGKGKFVIEALDMNRMVEEMGHILEVSISKKALLKFNLTRPLPLVEADATQLRQVLMNLVINASEAIGERSGVIAINTGSMECDSSYLRGVWLENNLAEGTYVYVEVSDNGCGMDRETAKKIFDPFFTTKFTGRGLGMAAVLGIIRGHRGAIKVSSEPGKGSTFRILLPASSMPEEPVSDTQEERDGWQGSGLVLFVDDEETVCAIGGEMLRMLGFDVVIALDGREAIEIFKGHPDISLVIIDLTMPHLDGEQTFTELRKIRPDLKVIMSSGYNEQEVTQRFMGKGLAGFVQKPYRLSDLESVVKRVYLAQEATD